MENFQEILPIILGFLGITQTTSIFFILKILKLIKKLQNEIKNFIKSFAKFYEIYKNDEDFIKNLNKLVIQPGDKILESLADILEKLNLKNYSNKLRKII